MMGANYRKPSQFNNHPQFIKGLLLFIVLILSTIATFITDNTPYWNDMAFIVWGLCIVTIVDHFDEK